MKSSSGTKKRTVVLIALFASVMLVTSFAAHAATNGDTLRVMTQGETPTGFCCTVWSDSIEVSQPEKPVPMVITWSADYRSTGPMLVGIRLNNGLARFTDRHTSPRQRRQTIRTRPARCNGSSCRSITDW